MTEKALGYFLMDAADLARIRQIIDDERAHPSLSYVSTPSAPLASTYEVIRAIHITTRPRTVLEDPSCIELKSVNYEMLSSLASSFDKDKRVAMHAYLLSRIGDAYAVKKVTDSTYPLWNGYGSELPLVGEFLIRAGSSLELFDVLAEAKPTIGLVLLLLELEQLVAVNWAILSDSELEHLSRSCAALRTSARALEQGATAPATWEIDGESISIPIVAGEAVASCDGLIEVCRKARYFNLKNGLSPKVNLEINQDKKELESHLQQLGFSAALIENLNHADNLRHAPSVFDLKGNMKYLRSFVENLHLEACARLASAGDTKAGRWGDIVLYLQKRVVLTLAEGEFVTGLYTALSDESLVPPIAEREYARLFRNVVVEYGLLLVKKLEQAFVTPTP